MDLNRLRLGEKVAGACAVLLFVDLFLDWYGVNVGLGVTPGRPNGVTINGSGWQVFSYTDILLTLLILVALTWVVLTATQRAPVMPVSFNVIVTAFGALMTLIVLYRLLNQPGPNDFVDVKYGAWLGLLLTAGIAAGGFLGMRDEGTTMADARAQADRLVSGRRPTQPAGGSASADQPAEEHDGD